MTVSPASNQPSKKLIQQILFDNLAPGASTRIVTELEERLEDAWNAQTKRAESKTLQRASSTASSSSSSPTTSTNTTLVNNSSTSQLFAGFDGLSGALGSNLKAAKDKPKKRDSKIPKEHADPNAITERQLDLNSIPTDEYLAALVEGTVGKSIHSRIDVKGVSSTTREKQGVIASHIRGRVYYGEELGFGPPRAAVGPKTTKGKKSRTKLAETSTTSSSTSTPVSSRPTSTEIPAGALYGPAPGPRRQKSLFRLFKKQKKPKDLQVIPDVEILEENGEHRDKKRPLISIDSKPQIISEKRDSWLNESSHSSLEGSTHTAYSGTMPSIMHDSPGSISGLSGTNSTPSSEKSNTESKTADLPNDLSSLSDPEVDFDGELIAYAEQNTSSKDRAASSNDPAASTTHQIVPIQHGSSQSDQVASNEELVTVVAPVPTLDSSHVQHAAENYLMVQDIQLNLPPARKPSMMLADKLSWDLPSKEFWRTEFGAQVHTVTWNRFSQALAEHIILLPEDKLVLRRILDPNQAGYISLTSFADFLNSHGSLKQALSRTKLYSKESWFVWHLSHEDCMNVLRHCPVGTFVVRFSQSSAGQFALTIKQSEGSFMKCLVSAKHGKYRSRPDFTDPSNPEYSSIIDLISNTSPNLLAFQEFWHQAPWFVGSLSSEDSLQRLRELPISGFFVRLSTRGSHFVFATVVDTGSVIQEAFIRESENDYLVFAGSGEGTRITCGSFDEFVDHRRDHYGILPKSSL